jgi:peroxiredoxin
MAIMIFSISSTPFVSADDEELNLKKFPGLKDVIENHESKDKLMNALKDAGTNWGSLAEAIISVDGKKLDDLLWQIMQMPHLDRLEATPEILLEHLEYAYKAKTDFAYKVPDDMFRQYILVYRIGYEPLTLWRKMIFERFKDMAGNTPTETAKNVNLWVFENVKERYRGIYGPQQAPDQVLRIELGSPTDIANLTTAILKSLGVPSRSARCRTFGGQSGGASWVEIFDGDKWIPLFPDDPDSFGDFEKFEKENGHNVTVVATTSAFSALQITPNYTETGIIELTFFRHGLKQKDFEDFSIAVYNNGGWIPLRDLGFNIEESRMSTGDEAATQLVLGDGTYLVEAGVRVKDGSVYVFTKQIELKAGDVVPLEIKLDPPIGDLDRKDLVARELDDLPEWELPAFDREGIFSSKLAYMSKYCVIAIFDLHGEPCQRMIPTLPSLKNFKKAKIKVWGIHAGPVDEAELKKFIDENGIDFPIIIDESGEVAEAFGLKRRKDDDKHFNKLPSILLLYRGADLLLWQEGYELGIAGYIQDLVAYQEELFE